MQVPDNISRVSIVSEEERVDEFVELLNDDPKCGHFKILRVILG